MSDSLQPHGLQHTRLPCHSLFPRVCSNSCPLIRWCHPTISSSVTPFSSCPQSFPASWSFPMIQLFGSCGQSTGTSASSSVLPVNIQGWFPLEWTCLILAVQGTIKSLLQHHNCHMTQQSHFCVYIQRAWKQDVEEITARPCSLKYYSQQPRYQFSSVAESCPTLCDPMNRSTPGLPVHHQLLSIESVMPSNHLILCHLLLLPSIPPSIRFFSNESTLPMRWPKYWSFSFSISPSNEHPGLISFRMDWLDLLAVQETLKSLLQHHSSKASILQHSAFFIVQLSYPYMTTGKTIAIAKI